MGVVKKYTWKLWTHVSPSYSCSHKWNCIPLPIHNQSMPTTQPNIIYKIFPTTTAGSTCSTNRHRVCQRKKCHYVHVPAPTVTTTEVRICLGKSNTFAITLDAARLMKSYTNCRLICDDTGVKNCSYITGYHVAKVYLSQHAKIHLKIQKRNETSLGKTIVN